MSETILKKDPLKAELFEDFNYVKTNKYSKLSALSIVIDLVSHKDKLFSGIAHREYDEMDLIQNIILNKKVIIDFCFKHPEAAYDVLYWPIMYKTLSPKDFKGYSKEVITAVDIDTKYAGYLARQQEQIDQAKKVEEKKIPADFDYLKLEGLRLEAREKLNKIKPLTVGMASRISGVSPADITVLLMYLK